MKKDNKEKKTINKKMLLIVTIGSIFVIIFSLISYFIIYPKILIKGINEKYELEEYDKVAMYYKKMDFIINFLNNEEEQNILEYKIKYSKALSLYNNKEYLEAIEIIKTINIPDEKSSDLENECNYNIALNYIKGENYSNAIDYLVIVNDKADKEDLLDNCYYKVALEFLNQKQFENALSTIKKIKKLDVKDTMKEIYYKYGINCYDSKNYVQAINHFEKVREYKTTEMYYNKSCILKSEEFIKANNYSSALEFLNKVSDNAECNGINAGKRKNQLVKAIELEKNIGRKKATSTYIETKNVWKYDGRWENWYIDKTSDEYIDISLTLNDDGSFNISGEAKFYIYDDFKLLVKYLKVKPKVVYFNFNNVYEVPYEAWLDTKTKFSYSDGIYKLDYYVEDNYSTNFYNIYKTTVSY